MLNGTVPRQVVTVRTVYSQDCIQARAAEFIENCGVEMYGQKELNENCDARSTAFFVTVPGWAMAQHVETNYLVL